MKVNSASIYGMLFKQGYSNYNISLVAPIPVSFTYHIVITVYKIASTLHLLLHGLRNVTLYCSIKTQHISNRINFFILWPLYQRLTHMHLCTMYPLKMFPIFIERDISYKTKVNLTLYLVYFLLHAYSTQSTYNVIVR